MTEHILVVDDDPQITSFLDRYLRKQGYNVTCTATGQQMRNVLKKEKIDLCVLDVGLPDADGFELTREIRGSSNLPIIVLSVRNEAFDRVFGLEYGADDYVTKPFEPRELVARIRSVLRRTNSGDKLSGMPAASTLLLKFGPWVANLSERTVIHSEGNHEAGLTSMEFDLLRAFLEQPRVALSRDQLFDLTRGQSSVVGDRAIDVHIMRLRKKLEADSRKPRYIKTIHGIGYCLADEVLQLHSDP